MENPITLDDLGVPPFKELEDLELMKPLLGGSSQDGRIRSHRITPVDFSHFLWPFGRGPTARSHRGLINPGY